MLKKLAVGLFIAAIAATGIVTYRDTFVSAQAGPTPRVDPHEAPVTNNSAALKPSQKLPITQVVLFNSGVGYFHRSGEVEGDTRVDLQFSAADINDLIKSLVVHDPAGKAMPMRYDSQEPIEKSLKSFAIDLSSNPGFGQILNQLRGQKVELTLQTTNPALNGQPGSLTGTIVGMETSVPPHSPTSSAVTEMELLNLSCAEGMRSIPISAVQRIRFLDPTVENELRRALEVVAVGRDTFKKSVRLGFKGEGKREVRIGYIVENPIWKTSYRLVKGENGKWRLQAWANVENTSDDDWNEIKLTLVSSRPISFQMDLYPPLFIPRPIVEPPLFASLRPPTYAGPIAGANPGALNRVMPEEQQGQGGQGFNGQAGQLFQGGQGVLGFGGGNIGQHGQQFGGNRYQSAGIFDPAGNRLTFSQMRERRKDQPAGDIGQVEARSVARQIGSALTNVDPDFIEQARAVDELGHPARFTIDHKVTLPRQQSIMLPILDEEIEATNLSIYNESVHATRSLLGLKIKNKTKQALMSGPVTVYEKDQPYNGDARILDLQPNEERYLSYALDTGVEIKPFDTVRPSPEMTVRVEGGQLLVQYNLRQSRTYVIVNRSPEARKIVIEQPIKEDWKLVTPTKPFEMTADLYRFQVDVKAGETVKFEVGEELPRNDPFSASKQADWTGFATTLGLDVWTGVKREPEDAFNIQVLDFPNAIQVTHKDRKATTYVLKNRSDEDCVIWLEHNVVPECKLIGDHEPIDKEGSRYRFKLELKKGKSLTHVVKEELKVARPESVALHTAAGSAANGPGEEEVPRQRFVTELGFDVWQTRDVVLPTLSGARFIKGELLTTAREVETITYHVRNRGKVERVFFLRHTPRANWVLTGDKAEIGIPGRDGQFTVKAAAESRVRQQLSESHSIERMVKVGEFSEDWLKAIVACPSVKDEVKESLKKAIALRSEHERTAQKLRDLRDQSKAIAEEQARLRTNMEKLPPTSELYKRYLAKLDLSETTLEQTQEQIKARETDERTQKKSLDDFLANLTVE